VYHFIASLAGEYAVETMCRLLAVSRSAYYHWLGTGKERDAGEKKKKLEERIVSVFQEHRRRYGVRRIVAELQANGIEAGAYQVRKVLQDKGLKAIQPRSFVPKTTDSHHPYPISANLLQQRAAPLKPNEVWVGDITYIPMIGGGFMYLAVWMDLYSRRIVG
jgi:putative transposase